MHRYKVSSRAGATIALRFDTAFTVYRDAYVQVHDKVRKVVGSGRGDQGGVRLQSAPPAGEIR
jgi:hypothetical protein